MKVALALAAALLALSACSGEDDPDSPAASSTTNPAASSDPAATSDPIVAATCDLAGGTFSIEEGSEATDFRFVGLDVPADAETVLYSASIGTSQFGTKIIGSEVVPFIFTPDGQTNLDPSAASVSADEVSTAFSTRDWVIADGTSVTAVLTVDGADVAQCKAPV
jgi:hypothetical protein